MGAESERNPHCALGIACDKNVHECHCTARNNSVKVYVPIMLVDYLQCAVNS